MKKILILFTLLFNIVVFSQKNNKNNIQVVESSITYNNQELFNKAISKFEAKKYNDAIGMLDQLIKNEPNISIGYYYLAQAYYETKQFNECSNTCTEGLKIDEKENLLYLYRVYANKAQNKMDGICSDIKKSFTTEEELLRLCK